MKELETIVDDLVHNGGRPYFVGSMVRYRVLGIKSKDIDIVIEVYGMDAQTPSKV